MNSKKIIIIILAFISFRCGDDIPDGVVDPVNENLHITSLKVPVDSVYNNPDKPLYISFRVNNPQNLKAAYYNLESPDGYEIFSKEALLDMKDTLTADDSTGDGVYSGRINLDSNSLYGRYILALFMENIEGEIIRGSVNTFVFDNGKGNHRPTITNVVAPDTLIRPTSGQVGFVISVEVFDSDGLNDIEKVYFNSYGPEFTTEGIPLWDNGKNGDPIANDGIYSAGLRIESQNKLGDYRFEFIAKDRRKAESNIIDHILTIVE